MLRNYVDPAVLYASFHNDALGKVWEAHHRAFANLVTSYKVRRVIEVGAGNGRLASLIPSLSYTAIDPQFSGKDPRIVVCKSLLNSDVAAQLAGSCDVVVSSHTLEHFIEFNEYFRHARTMLEAGGMLFTSVPNQEVGFAAGNGNMLCFEHPALCTNMHWLALHARNGFCVREVSTFRDHSLMIAAQKSEVDLSPCMRLGDMSRGLFASYAASVQRKVATIAAAVADKQKPNWLFGAHMTAQALFAYGVDERVFVGVVDNSPGKHGKRLYGTNLICVAPSTLLHNARVFLNIGAYNAEVGVQLQSIAPGVECIPL